MARSPQTVLLSIVLNLQFTAFPEQRFACHASCLYRTFGLSASHTIAQEARIQAGGNLGHG